jgi:alanyl-tRNA synthetase
LDATQLRSSFTRFFTERGHVAVPSASLIPHHPRAPLFTNAGMNQFIPYYLGEETPPYRRATSIQKCVRIRGKHDDIDMVGRTTRHLSFFEMLGNFSFGDYFKEAAIPWAWELLTGELGLDGERLWVTVFTDDDEADQIWREAVGVPAARIQRMGEDNFWEMGETGPCGPSSEIYYDRGAEFGAAGGPAEGGEERYVEIWNLVFTQYDRQRDGGLEPLPRPNIDTGAGFERLLCLLESVPSIWETSMLRPLIATAESVCGRTYGDDAEEDVTLRVLADHARSTALLIADGVQPSNDGRGYVLRRLIRRSVLAARRLGVEARITPFMAESVAAVLGAPYPALVDDLSVIQSVLEREEAGFDRTLRTGLALLQEALDEARAQSGATMAGDVAFRLHDTHGFPIELTEEFARESGVTVDRAAFEAAMAEQRARAREAARVPAAADEAAYRALVDAEGPTNFIGRSPDFYSIATRVIGVLGGTEGDAVEIFLAETPFYAEGGGQVGDTGTIVTETGRAEVYDTVPAVPGLVAHRARLSGEIFVGQEALATIDGERREALRRNHTGTHLLHSALRRVLGDHVRQQSSYVAPDHLRFDFSHHAAPAREELGAVIDLVNSDVLTDDAVLTTEATRAEAETMGALAFFGDKYGDVVRVVRAGPHSLEFCGGTHVHALGQIGPLQIVSESSIGANTRRIEAVTGAVALERTARRQGLLDEAAAMLRTEPDELIDALGRLLERQRATERELQGLRGAARGAEAAALAAGAEGGVVTARVDGRNPNDLRDLAQAILRSDGVRGVGLVGSAEAGKVAIVAATDASRNATEIVKQVAPIVGGGGGGTPQLALAGGRDPSKLDQALAELRRLLIEG